MNQWQELISRRLEDVLRCMAFLGHLTPEGALPKGAHEYSWLTYFFLFPIFMCMQMFANVCVRVAVVLGYGPAASVNNLASDFNNPKSPRRRLQHSDATTTTFDASV